ncbi:MAG TPA: membrane protein insertase YidC [Candidatus Parabacteroides intestinigallinarum]|uniref:Membrane protein insertase YidC n=1 Tax=Candidatus Parabacteroides intestinigallinarum TaxID=2838722 RepID=A0A9D2BND0_9BACT|nr:membrane protein insertase YidC [Candidatus Parabacteroides intestinigallinarum]
MDKNTLIGFLLIGVVLVAFSWFNRPTPEQIEAQRHYQDSIAKIEYAQQMDLVREAQREAFVKDSLENLPDSVRASLLRQDFGVFANVMTGTETYTTLQNDVLELRVSNKGGRICYARLKEFDNYKGEPLVLFDENSSSLTFNLVTAASQVLSTDELYFTPVKGDDPNQLIMRLQVENGRHLDFTYTLEPGSYRVGYRIQGTGLNGLLTPSTNALDIAWTQDIHQQEKGRMFEDRYVNLSYKYMADDVEHLSETKSDSEKISNRLRWIGYKDMFFSTVLISEEGFEATTLDSKSYAAGEVLKQFKTNTSVAFDLRGEKPTELSYYFGPNKFALLKSFDKGVDSDLQLDLEKLVPLGWGIFRWVNQYFVIPLFDFLGKFIPNYGLLIFLLTVIVKLILYPLTYKSYISSAKMRVLRPQVEEINAKYPGQDQALERQKATMELYSRAGASPLSGCLPLLLQMPILIALFMFFPSAIELRHESFLWANDLSTYDAIVSWETYIPIITPYFGNHISLFCLLMTITNIIYTKYNMDMTNTGQQQMPGMKLMMYLMPLMFLVFFNQYASGLTYYYFISMLISIVQTLIFRFTINEEKLLAKLEANKRKPMKKSGLMKRLEEAQRMQEEQLKKQQEARHRNRR